MRSFAVQLSLHSVGISLITDTPEEALYVSLFEPEISYVRIRPGEDLSVVSVKNMQIDNHLSDAKWPVVLNFSSTRAAENKGIRPVLQFTADRKPESQKDVIGFNGIHLALQRFSLRADENLALQLLKVVEELKTDLVESHDRLWLERDILNAQDMYRLQIDKLLINPVEFDLSFSSSRALKVKTSLRYRMLLRPALTLFGNLERVNMQFDSIDLEGVFDTKEHLISLLTKYYSKFFAKQRLRLATSSKLLGNPAALFDTVSAETNHVFYSPADGAGSEEFLNRFGNASSAVASGVLKSLGGVTGSISNAIEAWTDDEFNAERRLILSGNRNERVMPSTGIIRGMNAFGKGIQSGLAGLINKPIQGAMEGGAGGFASGLSSGLTGAIAKPIVGGFDLFSQPTAGLANMLGHQPVTEAVVPVRPPRSFKNHKNIRNYSWREEMGQALFRFVEPDPPEYSRLIGWIELTSKTESDGDDTEHLSTLWLTFASFIYEEWDPRQSAKRNRELFEKRIAIVTSLELMFMTFSGQILWRKNLRDIEQLSEMQHEPEKLFIKVKHQPKENAEVSCGSATAKRILLGFLSRADRHLRSTTITHESQQHSSESVKNQVEILASKGERPFEGDEEANRVETQVVIVNETASKFTFVQEGLLAGEWISFPPQEISPSDACTFQAFGSEGDVRGIVCYEVQGSDEYLIVDFSNLFPEKNSIEIHCPKHIQCSTEETEGRNALVTLMLTQERAYLEE
eukprot:Plantae.Rhodophyta-Purpureofilum_apyrenoidigerum.ctg15615.p1 GENE.Plantae.Rhodophyta-Purpureofilum_apyrenoidigerum.ctg15615~~Plantae.Rhodophyta-Purpureofilum_apyrenoidigerum.ctg15615.p1  ORF type:complete len:743 (-),score=130.95 Plantae.Rhodophyta-Purpureofilum_apyrenoidigerum.ctg15615:288-2516(-)